MLRLSSRSLVAPTARIDSFSFKNLCTSQPKDSIHQISRLLQHPNWKSLITSSDLPNNLTPQIIQSVLHQNQHLDPKRLHSFFCWSTTQMGIPQTLNSFSLLVVSLCNSHSFGLANFLFDEMITIHFPNLPPQEVLDSIVGCYREREGSKDVVFELLIDAFKKTGMLKEVMDVFWGTKSIGFIPSLICCSDFLTDLMKANMMEEYCKVYDRMVEENVSFDAYTYTNVVRAFCKVGNAEQAKKVFDDISETGLVPNEYTYNTLIGGLCKLANMDKAFGLYEEMCKKGIKPTIVTFNLLVDGLCKSGDVERAREVFDSIPEKGLAQNYVTYTMLIGGYCTLGNLVEMDKAFKLYDEMCKEGVKPTIVTFTVLIDGLCKSGDVEKAKKCLMIS